MRRLAGIAARLALCAAGLAAAGCLGDALAQQPGRADAGPSDAGAQDARAADAGASGADAGAADAGATDAGAAEAGAPRKRPVVTTPRPKGAIVVPYPENASGEQTVVLELTIDAAGSVRGVRVIEGSPPFSTAAIQEAAAAQFIPGERDGVAVPARFLLRVEVKPPDEGAPAGSVPGGARPGRRPGIRPRLPGLARKPPAGKTDEGEGAPPTGAAAGRPAATGAAGGPAAGDVEPKAIEVTVEGEKTPPAREPAETTLTTPELARMPGAFGDAFRAVEVIPGVVPMVSGLPYFFVRGAAPGASGYLLDGIRVPFLFHFGAGPSVVSPALIDHVDFFPGAYPARYGRQVGGILAASTREPSPRPRGEALVRLIDSGAFVEAPFAGGRASAFAGGRYSYAGAILQLFAPDNVLRYWDYQAGASLALGPRDRLGLLVFGSDDFVGEIDRGREQVVFGAQFHRGDLRWDHTEPGGGRARVAATLGWDRTALGDEGAVRSRLYGFRGDVDAPLGEPATLRVGTSMTIDDTDAMPPFSAPVSPLRDFAPSDDPGVTEQFPGRTAGTFGVYADVVWHPVSPVEIVPGLRVDLFGEGGGSGAGQKPTSGGVVAVDPRLALRLKVLPMIRTVSLFGLTHQRPSLLAPVPGLEPAGAREALQEALQVSQGVELSLPADVSASASFFHHTYWDLTDASATCGSEVEDCTLRDRADGRAFGLELMVQRPLTKKLGGWIGYTLSRSERVARGERFPADFDRTHVLHLVVGYEPAPGWHAAARFTTYSGRPHSLLAFDDPQRPDEATQIGKTNAVRLPAFYRLDLRLERRWRIGATGYVGVVLEGVNVTLTKETVDFDCQIADEGGAANPGIECGRQEIGPITLPSLGLFGGF